MRINPTTGDLLKGIGRAWLTDTLWIQQAGSDSAGWKTVDQFGREIDGQGFNVVAAGGGKWATWLAGRGPKGNFGPLDPAGIVLDIGRDGTVAWCPDYQAGMHVQGSLALSTRVCGPDHIVYALADRRVYSTQLGFAKIPAGVTPFKAYVLDGALLYHTHEHLILQRYHESIGKVVAEKPAYSPDMIRVPGGWRVVWCLNEGETLTAERIVTDAELVTDLSGVRDFTVVDPPQPPKPPQPPTPPEPKMKNVLSFLQAHPLTRLLGTPKGPGKEEERAWNAFRALAAAVRDLNIADGAGIWGLEKDPSGDFRPIVNGIGYWGDGIRTKTEGNDVISDREGEGAHWIWSSPGPAALVGERGFVPPPSDAEITSEMKLRGFDVGDGPVQPPKPPDIPPPSDLEGIKAELRLVQATLKAHDGDLRFQAEEMVLVKNRVHDIEQKPPSAGTLPKLKIVVDHSAEAITTNRTYGHNHTLRLAVIPEE